MDEGLRQVAEELRAHRAATVALTAELASTRPAMESTSRRTGHNSILLLALIVVALVLGLNSLTNRQVLNQVEDCTNPTGECYRNGQDRTGAYVESIVLTIRDESRELRELVCEEARRDGSVLPGCDPPS